MEFPLDPHHLTLSDIEALQGRVRESMFRGELDFVRVEDLKIEPWKLASLELVPPEPGCLRLPEITNAAERYVLAEEAMIAAQDILWVYHGLGRQPGTFRRRLAGLCAEGSALAQELS